jgi:hypothetical protein
MVASFTDGLPENVGLFGLVMRTALRLGLPGRDLRIRPELRLVSSLIEVDGSLKPALESELWSHTGRVGYQFRPQIGRDLIRIDPVADFRISRDEISYQLRDGCRFAAFQDHLLGSVMALWLERRGWPVLHAASVEVAGCSIVMLASSGMGKSTLTAELVRQGFRALSDDLIAVEEREDGFWIRPSYPTIGLRVRGSAEKEVLTLAADEFCGDPKPVSAVFVLNRRVAGQRREEPTITRLPPAEAVVAAIRYSFAPRTANAAGLAGSRLALFARMARQVPTLRLDYDSALAGAGDVARFVAEVARRCDSQDREASLSRKNPAYIPRISVV